MKKKIVVLLVVGLWMLGAGISTANDGVPWRNHAFPFTFLFGNHIDTHQQTKLLHDGDLFGFFYITFTGEETDGFPVAKHCEESTPPKKCVAGWILRAKPGQATFVFHQHEGHEHPLWLVNRTDIPQPGAFAHFHWLGAPNEADGLVRGDIHNGYFLELFAIRTFAFQHGDHLIPVTPGIDIATHVNIVATFPVSECPGCEPPPHH